MDPQLEDLLRLAVPAGLLLRDQLDPEPVAVAAGQQVVDQLGDGGPGPVDLVRLDALAPEARLDQPVGTRQRGQGRARCRGSLQAGRHGLQLRQLAREPAALREAFVGRLPGRRCAPFRGLDTDAGLGDRRVVVGGQVGQLGDVLRELLDQPGALRHLALAPLAAGEQLAGGAAHGLDLCATHADVERRRALDRAGLELAQLRERGIGGGSGGSHVDVGKLGGLDPPRKLAVGHLRDPRQLQLQGAGGASDLGEPLAPDLGIGLRPRVVGPGLRQHAGGLGDALAARLDQHGAVGAGLVQLVRGGGGVGDQGAAVALHRPLEARLGALRQQGAALAWGSGQSLPPALACADGLRQRGELFAVGLLDLPGRFRRVVAHALQAGHLGVEVDHHLLQLRALHPEARGVLPLALGSHPRRLGLLHRHDRRRCLGGGLARDPLRGLGLVDRALGGGEGAGVRGRPVRLALVLDQCLLGGRQLLRCGGGVLDLPEQLGKLGVELLDPALRCRPLGEQRRPARAVGVGAPLASRERGPQVAGHLVEGGGLALRLGQRLRQGGMLEAEGDAPGLRQAELREQAIRLGDAGVGLDRDLARPLGEGLELLDPEQGGEQVPALRLFQSDERPAAVLAREDRRQVQGLRQVPAPDLLVEAGHLAAGVGVHPVDPQVPVVLALVGVDLPPDAPGLAGVLPLQVDHGFGGDGKARHAAPAGGARPVQGERAEGLQQRRLAGPVRADEGDQPGGLVEVERHGAGVRGGDPADRDLRRLHRSSPRSAVMRARISVVPCSSRSARAPRAASRSASAGGEDRVRQ